MHGQVQNDARKGMHSLAERAPAAETDFSAKLALALKMANMSRGGLAAAAGVDKSLVGRWVRGLVRPTDHNLSLVTDVLRARLPGFTRLAWDLGMPDFAATIGAPILLPDARPRAETRDEAGAIALPQSLARSRIEVSREGCAYPGTYVGFRLAFKNTGDLTSEIVSIWREGDRLFFRQYGAAFTHEGEALLLRNQLHLIGEENERVNGLYFVVLNGVSGERALRLDGVFCTVFGDKLHTPSATLIVYERVLDAGANGALPDPAQLAMLHASLRRHQEEGRLQELAGPQIEAALRARLGAEDADHVLRAPAHRSLSVSELDATPCVHEHMRALRGRLGV